jgi:hypothetical protein
MLASLHPEETGLSVDSTDRVRLATMHVATSLLDEKAGNTGCQELEENLQKALSSFLGS